MSKAIQRRRGTTAQHAAFAGLAGEVTVDTDKKTLVVHDGATLGGAPLAREGHGHAIADTTGLQAALDGKLGATAKAADSDKLDGMQPATAATSSTVAARDASGDLTANVFHGTATAARYA